MTTNDLNTFALMVLDVCIHREPAENYLDVLVKNGMLEPWEKHVIIDYIARETGE